MFLWEQAKNDTSNWGPWASLGSAEVFLASNKRSLERDQVLEGIIKKNPQQNLNTWSFTETELGPWGGGGG